MKLFLSICAFFLLLVSTRFALGMAPGEMARNGQLEDLKLWVNLQVESLDVAHPHWKSFAQLAAKTGHLEILQYLNNIGVELERYGDFGDSPLHEAASHDEIEVIHWLLEIGFDVDTQETINDWTALHRAVRYGSVETVATLLKAGADPLMNSEAGTVFEFAEDFDILHKLLEHWAKKGDGMPPPGISPASWWSFENQPDRVPERFLRKDLSGSGCHALHWATASGHMPTLRRVLDLAPNAALSSLCLDTHTALQVAIRFNRAEVVAELLNRWQQVEIADLRLAAGHGSATLMRTLYEALEDEPEALGIYTRSGHAVFEHYDPEDMQYLIDKQVISPLWVLDQIGQHGDELIDLVPSVLGQDVSLMQVFRTGLRFDNTALVDWVLTRNPPLPQWNKDDDSPFIVAADAGNTELAKRLWQPDAVFGKDNYYQRLEYFARAGWTEKVLAFTRRRSDLLSYALNAGAVNGKFDLIAELVEAGARAEGHHCDTVFTAAIYGNKAEVLRLLAETHSGRKKCLTGALIDVVEKGRTDMLLPLLENGADPNGEGESFNNAVVKAVRQERLTILIDLLKAGADPGVVDDPEDEILKVAQSALGSGSDDPAEEEIQEPANLTPLMKAASTGDLSRIRELLSEGDDINQTNQRGETPAHIAIRAGQLSAASLLLGYDVLLTKDDRGRTPFHLVAAYGSPELAARAMKLSRGVYAKDEHERYPLDYAARLNEPVAMLLTEDAAQHTDNLHTLAASYGQQDLMDYLSELYVAGSTEDYLGKPEAAYFMVAIYRDDREWWEALLDHSLEPDDHYLGEPLLYMAARYENLAAMRQLVSEGAALSTDLFRIAPAAPYCFAIRAGDPKLAESLLDSAGWLEKDEILVDSLECLGNHLSEEELVTWLESDGEDVLDESLVRTLYDPVRMGEQLNLLRAMVRAGADLYEEDYSDESPVIWAKEKLEEENIGWPHRLALVALLAKAEAGPSTAVWKYLHDGMDALDELDAEELGTRDVLSGMTLLDAAVFRGDTETIRYLLQNGAGVTASTMHILAERGNVSILELLATEIYDLNARDGLGNTPLITAVKADRREMVEALLAIGARTNAYNADYRYPLKLAVMNGSEPVVRALLDHGAHPDGFSEHMSSNALTSAVINNDPATARALVEAGASEDPLLGPPPHSVHTYGYKFGGVELLGYLEQAFPRTEAERESDLDTAWRFNNEPGIKHLLEQGVSL